MVPAWLPPKYVLVYILIYLYILIHILIYIETPGIALTPSVFSLHSLVYLHVVDLHGRNVSYQFRGVSRRSLTAHDRGALSLHLSGERFLRLWLAFAPNQEVTDTRTFARFARTAAALTYHWPSRYCSHGPPSRWQRGDVVFRGRVQQVRSRRSFGKTYTRSRAITQHGPSRSMFPFQNEHVRTVDPFPFSLIFPVSYYVVSGQDLFVTV
jgi:hypothetical protein